MRINPLETADPFLFAKEVLSRNVIFCAVFPQIVIQKFILNLSNM